jgi:hypothetical protein
MRFRFGRKKVREVEAGIHLSAIVTVEIRKADGRLVYHSEGKNLVVDTGFDWLAAQIGGTALAVPMGWIGLSANTDAVDPTDTALPGEYTDDGMLRAVASYAHTGGTKVFTLSKTFTKGAGAVKTPGKTGLFNQLAVGGTMLAAYLIPSPPPLLSTDQLSITWTITLS